MANGQVEFRIYVADLHEYNAGRLVGSWLTPNDYADEDALQAAIAACMSAPDHEYAIHDTEGVSHIAGCESAAKIMQVSAAIEVHGTEKVEHLLEQGRNNGWSTLGDDIAEADRGDFASKEDWAEDYIGSCYDLDKMLGQLASYFDYAAFARDAELNGDVTFIRLSNGNVWVLGE